VPRIDELGYLSELRRSRPELLTDAECYRSLVLKPRFRPRLLGGTDTYDSIEAAEFSPDARAADLAWLRAHERREVAFCETTPVGGCKNICLHDCGACPAEGIPPNAGPRPAVFPSGYPLCGFVGYAENSGTGGTIFDPSGVVLDWKVFFELKDDFATTLSPERLVAFADRLAAAGFRGDAKIPTDPMLPGQERFQYNDVIIHGHSPDDARIAERVGLAFFGVALAGHGRGLDVGSPPDAHGALDWHHFLCQGDLGVLSDEAMRFVRFDD
jgi:hypothetical protein